MGAAVRFLPLRTIKPSPEDLSVASVSLTLRRRVFEDCSVKDMDSSYRTYWVTVTSLMLQ